MALPTWETVTPIDNYRYTHRLSVFGGWIVRCHDAVKDTMTCCFIPDADHEWTLEE